MSSPELDQLLAKQAITEVIYRYCRSMDRMDVELGYSVWHDGGTADYGSLFKGSGRGFIDWVTEYHRALQAQSHQVANILIEVDGDTARSESYITVALFFAQEGRDMLNTGRGRYLDQWARRDGRWAIMHRDFVLDFTDTREVASSRPGWFKRDKSDRSYEVIKRIGNA
ncbi:MAG: nuclear transport factor 2 family protein [Georgfuchsia sp.]